MVKKIHKSTDVDVALETLQKEKQKHFAITKPKNPRLRDLTTKVDKGVVRFQKEKEVFIAVTILTEYLGCNLVDDGSADNDRVALHYLQTWVVRQVDENPYKWLADVRVETTSHERAINTQMKLGQGYCEKWTNEDSSKSSKQ